MMEQAAFLKDNAGYGRAITGDGATIMGTTTAWGATAAVGNGKFWGNNAGGNNRWVQQRLGASVNCGAAILGATGGFGNIGWGQ